MSTEDFNELFNEFFDKNDKDNKNNKDEFKKLDNMFKSLNDFFPSNNDMGYEKDMGEPTTVEITEKNGMVYVTKIWKTDSGFVKLTTIEDAESFDRTTVVEKPGLNINKLSLEKQLEIAVKEENFEQAAILRDKINESKKNINN